MKSLIISLKIFFFFTIVTGVVYPLLVTGIGQVVFAHKANGSLIVKGNETTGSELIGQQFDSAIYFIGRPSVSNYNGLSSGGSNYGLTNAKLKNLVEERRTHFIAFNGLDTLTAVPAAMLFASASGLDPHISPQAAMLQVERVCKARNFTGNQKRQLEQLVDELTEKPQFGLLGEERINVLILNIKTDELNSDNK